MPIRAIRLRNSNQPGARHRNRAVKVYSAQIGKDIITQISGPKSYSPVRIVDLNEKKLGIVVDIVLQAIPHFGIRDRRIIAQQFGQLLRFNHMQQFEPGDHLPIEQPSAHAQHRADRDGDQQCEPGCCPESQRVHSSLYPVPRMVLK